MTSLDSILKSRDISLPTRVCIVKAMVFPVVMYRCECWSIKKAEHQRTEAFAMWCWRRPLKVPWTTRSNQSILKEISSEYSLEGLKLKLQYCDHLMWRTDPLEKTLILGKTWRQKKRAAEDKIDSMVKNLSKLQDIVKDREVWCVNSPWSCKERDTVYWLNNNNKTYLNSPK